MACEMPRRERSVSFLQAEPLAPRPSAQPDSPRRRKRRVEGRHTSASRTEGMRIAAHAQVQAALRHAAMRKRELREGHLPAISPRGAGEEAPPMGSPESPLTSARRRPVPPRRRGGAGMSSIHRERLLEPVEGLRIVIVSVE